MKTCSLLILALVACGDDGARQLPDAPLIDAAADPDAPTSGVVSLTITGQGTPVEGVDVYFQNADSSLVAKVTTDATGVASATMEPGGFVTAVDPYVTQRGIAFADLRTFAAVKPGDELLLQQGSASTPITLTFVLPTDDGLTAEYDVNTTCGSQTFVSQGSGTMPGGVGSYSGCGTTLDVLVVARDPQGTPTSWLYQAGVAVTDGGTIDLTASTYQAIVETSFVFQNGPAAASFVELSNALISPRGVVSSLSRSSDLTAGAGTVNVSRAQPAGTTSVTTAMFQDTSGTPVGQHAVLAWSPTAATHTIDLAGALLPEYSQAPAVAAATHTIAWTSTGTTQPDFVISRIEAIRESPLLGWRWQMVAPYTGTSVALPVLPTDLAAYNYVATDLITFDDLITAKVPGGYDAVRARLLALDGPEGLVTGASGQIVIQQLNRPQVVRTTPVPAWFSRTSPSRSQR